MFLFIRHCMKWYNHKFTWTHSLFWSNFLLVKSEFFSLPGNPCPSQVIVDLAAQGGGNCELTKLNEIVTTPNGVTIIGYADMPARGWVVIVGMWQGKTYGTMDGENVDVEYYWPWIFWEAILTHSHGRIGEIIYVEMTKRQGLVWRSLLRFDHLK